MNRARARAARAMMMAIRVADKEVGEGSKVTRVAGEQMAT